jgi:hypothetical protein
VTQRCFSVDNPHQSVPPLRRMLAYANRVGITIARHGRDEDPPTESETIRPT